MNLVLKENDAFRACVDYHAFNSFMKPDLYPIPHIYDITAIIQDKSIFSTINLTRVHNQLPVESADIPKIAITTSFCLFEFLRLQFDLRNAGQTFQRFIHHVLDGLDFVCAYIDDVLVASSSAEEHMKHLRMIFERFKKYGIVINQIKCEFGKTEVAF